jgi:hypothetical protein
MLTALFRQLTVFFMFQETLINQAVKHLRPSRFRYWCVHYQELIQKDKNHT